MPYLNLRAVPLPSDLDEAELLDVAQRSAVSVRFNNVARNRGQPHVELYARADPRTPIGVFKRSAAAIAWLIDGDRDA